MTHRFTIVGLGEALIDILPDAQHTGGAPLNVAVHAHQLGKHQTGQGLLVTRVGQDPLGQQIIDHLTSRQMDTTYIQSDPDLSTGRVYVNINSQGQPEYDILENVAWDVIQYDSSLDELARRCDAVCFGTLAQRHPQSRQSIYRFLAEARHAVKLLDVNLRGQYYDAAILRRSCEQATVVKLNQEELPVVCRELGMDAQADEQAACRSLLHAFDLKMIVLTRGKLGTLLIMPQNSYEGQPVSYPAAEQADSVGAGDACTAAILVGLALRQTPEKLVNLANHAGAFVASQPGATPVFPKEILDLLG